MNTITKKSTGLKSNNKVSDLKSAAITSIHEWVSKVCNININDGSKWNILIEKQIEQNICPLEAESWEYKSKGGYRLVIFTSSFSTEFKEMITENFKADWKEIIDLEHEQITAGTEYDF